MRQPVETIKIKEYLDNLDLPKVPEKVKNYLNEPSTIEEIVSSRQ